MVKSNTQYINSIDPKQKNNASILKPKPLSFDVNMLDKMFMHSPHKKKKGLARETERDTEKAKLRDVTVVQHVEENGDNVALQVANENANSKKLPFRFQGI